MNKLIITFSAFVLFCSCNTYSSKEPDMKIVVNIIAKLSQDNFKGKEGSFYSINIDLINNTASIVCFWSMLCS